MSNKFMSTSQAAEKWGVSSRRVATLCEENRIEGVEKVGNSWAIPVDAEKPKDARIKSGKYIREKKEADNNGNADKY